MMKNKLQLGLVLGMIFLFTNGLGQTNVGATEKIENNKAPESHLSLLLDATKANLNFGKLNRALSGSLKSIPAIHQKRSDTISGMSYSTPFSSYPKGY